MNNLDFFRLYKRWGKGLDGWPTNFEFIALNTH